MEDRHRPPVIENLIRQHAEQAAFLWTVYDWNLLNPDDNPDMDAERMARLTERLDAHLDGLRTAGPDGLRMAEERYAEFPHAGELFVVRMLQEEAEDLSVRTLDLDRVRAYLSKNSTNPDPRRDRI